MGVTLDWLDGSLGPLIGDLSHHGCCFVSTALRDILFVVVLCRMLFSLGCMESEQHTSKNDQYIYRSIPLPVPSPKVTVRVC